MTSRTRKYLFLTAWLLLLGMGVGLTLLKMGTEKVETTVTFLVLIGAMFAVFIVTLLPKASLETDQGKTLNKVFTALLVGLVVIFLARVTWSAFVSKRYLTALVTGWFLVIFARIFTDIWKPQKRRKGSQKRSRSASSAEVPAQNCEGRVPPGDTNP
jgi:hypothetical protein